MNSIDGVRRVPAGTNMVIFAAALIVPALVALFLVCVKSLFPDAAPVSLDVWVSGHGATQTQAVSDFKGAKNRALLFLKRSGFALSDISAADFSAVRSASPPGWDATQRLSVSGTSYARFSTMSNDVSKMDPSGKHLSPSFPAIPFQGVLAWIIILTIVCLCMSAASIEFRAADVSVPARGMHPLIVLNQVVLCVLAIMSALAYVHLNALAARVPFAIVASAIVASLAAWLFRTRTHWRQSPFLARAYIGCIVAAVVVAGSLAAALIKGPA